MKSDQIYAEKCDFVTSIFHPSKQYPAIREDIDQAFDSVYYEDEFGEQHGFIATLVSQRLRIVQDSKVYLVNLREKEGSYLLEFALIIVAGLGDYGGMREGLDYLRADIAHIFKMKLEKEYKINVDYTVTEITERENKRQANLFNFDIDKILNDKRVWISLSAFLCFLLVIVSQSKLPKEEEKNVQFDDMKNEIILNKKFDEYVKNRKMDMILERLILQPDTIPVKNN